MASTTLAERIKYAMEHLSRKQYVSLLARPNWRRIQRRDMNAVVKPFSTRRAALKARASKRIKAMARPKYVGKKYDPATAPPLFPKLNPKILQATATKRIEELAVPHKRTLQSNLRFPTATTVAEMLVRARNSRYKRYRYFCNARIQREMKKKKKIMAKLRRVIKPHEWNHHMQWIGKLAIPKMVPRPRFPDKRRRWRPPNMRRIEELSSPVARDSPGARALGKVAPGALAYVTTDHIRQIAQPKKVWKDEEGIQLPARVHPAALKAVATERTLILAKPVERPAGIETDLREDAFTVSPLALKAKCSRRLKQLARPKTRR